jgi:hypothetical protein
MKVLIQLCFLIALAISIGKTQARKPAVEPVMGISIDHYKKTDPKKDKGFNWNEQTNKVENKVNTARPSNIDLNIEIVPQKALVYDLNIPTSKAPVWPSFLLGALLIFLPVALWFGIMKSLRKEEQSNEKLNDNSTQVSPLTLVNGESSPETKDEGQNKDKDFPKAS